MHENRAGAADGLFTGEGALESRRYELLQRVTNGPIRWWQCASVGIYVVGVYLNRISTQYFKRQKEIFVSVAVLTADLAAFEGNFVLVPKIDFLASIV